MIKLLAAMGATLALISAGAEAFAQPAAQGPRAFSPTYYDLESVEIKMRDGVSLHTDIIRPKAPSRYPIFMIRTPYAFAKYCNDRRSSLVAAVIAFNDDTFRLGRKQEL